MTKRALRFYWQFYDGKRLSIFFISCLLVLQPIILTGTFYIIKKLFDNMLKQDTFLSLMLISLGLILLYLFSGGLALFVRYRMMKLTHDAIQSLRRELSTRLYAFSRSQYAEFDRKSLQTMLVQDVIRVDVMTNALAGELIPSLIIMLSMIGVFIYLNFTLFLVVVCLFPVLILLESVLRPMLRRLIQAHHRSLELLQKQTLFGLEALDLTHTRGVQELEIEQQISTGELFRLTSTRLVMLRETLSFIQDALMLIVSIICLLIGGKFILQGKMSGGEVFVFYAAIVVLRPYIRSSWATVPQIIEGIESLKTLTNWTMQSETQPNFGNQQFDFSGEVTFHQVQFDYSQRPLLKQVDLHIQSGQTVAILGPNGSGKSTLAYLLLGFYQPKSGTIVVDGHPLKEVEITSFRQQIGVVPQNPFIFQGTILQNIIYGIPHLEMESVIWAAEVAQIHSFIQSFPDGYNTIIGDNGMLLSGGQRQRIALARALLTRPPFLILDEPTNHLDANAVQQIMRLLQNGDYKPTCLLITHDMMLADYWDVAYYLEHGSLSCLNKQCNINPNGPSYKVEK